MYLLFAAFMLVFLFFGKEIGYSDGSPWWTHFTYIFQHGSWLHLLLNSVALWSLFHVINRFYRPVIIFIVAVAVAVAASFFCIYDKPVVGASGMVYSLLGWMVLS